MLGLSETAATDLGIGSLETSNFCDIKANGIVSKRVCPSLWPKQDYTHTEVETKLENMVDEEHGKIELFDNSSQGSHNAPGPVIPEQMEFARGGAADVNLREDAVSKLEPIEKEQIVIGNETTSCRLDVNKEAGSGWNVSKPACMEDSITDVPKSEPVGMEGAMLSHLLSVNSHVDETSSLDALNNDNVIGITDDGVIGITGNQEASLTDTAMVSSGVEPSRSMNLLEITKKLENAGQVLRSSGSAAFLERKKRPSNEVTKMKKEKRKQVLSKADATGINTDLYMAYIGPEEKREPLLADSNKVAACDTGESPIPNVGEMKHEVEHDDWEDAADISTPRLKTSENGELACGKKKFDVEYGNGAKSKKYSRDFLLTFRKQYTDLPVGFEIGQDIADILMGGQANTPDISDRKPFPSAGRVIDRPNGAIRDRRLVGLDDGKWTKASTPFIIGRDMRADLAIFRSGHGANVGVLRDHHVQSSPCDGGILAGPISLGGISRSNADADRWQRGPGVQGGPVPSPQTPKQVMHKAEKKYEVGKISDEEEAKQRQLKAILNKLTPQNFDRLFEQVKEVKIDNAVTLTGVISQIFDKALMEPTFCEMYANFCFHLAGVLPDFTEGGEKFTFKRLLLNKCQEEFERGEREQDEANRAEEGELNQSAQGREEKKIKARRRMLGNIRLIGELYKKKMPTERIMHECIQKLLGQYHNPDEEDLESLCKLMSTIGEMIDHPKAKEHMDAYFDMMTKLSTSQKLSSRVRFMLRDAIDLRRNRWQQRRKVEGPKKIEEVHRDAAQERQTQASRSARGPGIGSSRRGPPPADYCSRGSMLSSPSSKLIGVSSNSPFLGHVFGTQNIRLEDRHLFESRTTSVPLPHRPNEENPITLGPQGNLGRGMSIRGQPLMPTFPLSDVSSKSGDLQRMGLGLNGYGSRNELVPRYIQERHSGAPCESSKTDGYEHNPYLGGRVLSSEDSGLDTSSAATSPADQGPMSLIGSKNAPSEPKPFSEECLQEKSLSTIREFYSAKDEKEVVLCVRELNSPSFYPAMVSLWVTDSFERKDVDRESLAKLLVSLSKPQDSLLTQGQLIQGFESVLFSLEDTVTDAPRAAEFLGGIFAKVILADAISLKEIGRLIQHGGEEPGRLLVIGLASEVLGSTLDNIKTQKGDTVFNEIRLSFNLQLEDFQPPHPIKSRKLDAFL